MGGLVKEGSLAWVLLNNTTLHLPKRSDWRIASTAGWDANVGTPWIKLSADRVRIVIPIVRYDGTSISDTKVLTGMGLGISAGLSVSVPFFSYSWSGAADPGSGTPIYETMFCPEPLEARHLQGFCYVFNISGAWSTGGKLAARQASAAMLIFTDKLSLGSMLPTSINAVAFANGLGSSAIDFASIGAEAAVYNLTLKSSPTLRSK